MRLYRKRTATGAGWVWWASWTQDGATVRRSTRCTVRSAAELVCARWERERADPIYEAANTATLGEECVIFIRECETAAAKGQLSPHTVKMYVQKLGNVCDVLGRKTRLAEIEPERVGTYFAQRSTEGASDSTLYKEWVALRGVLKSARHRQHYHRDPAALRPPRLTPSYRPKERWLSWAELRSLTAALKPERAAAVSYAVGTGCRRSELFRARPSDIGAWSVVIHGTKTKSSARSIPIPVPFIDLVTDAAAHMPFRRWPNARRDLASACAAVGIPPVTWNDLRRTFASLLIQAGFAPHVVARLMGHTTTQMVDRTYGRTDVAGLAGMMTKTTNL